VKLKWVVLFAAVMLSAQEVWAGQYFYWVDFGSPLNQVNQPPATNAGPLTPSKIVFGGPTVVSSFGHLTNQPLLFKGTYYEQIQFDLGKQAPDYFIDFDFETRKLNPSLFAFTVIFDDPWAEVFYLHGTGYIGVPPSNSPGLPGWTDYELHHMHIVWNVPAATWFFKLDDRGLESRRVYYETGDVLDMRLNLSAWRAFTPGDKNVQVAVDNIRIGTSAPAPPPRITCSAPLTLECGNSVATLNVSVEDRSTNPLNVVWQVDGISYQTNTLPAGWALTPTNVPFTADFGLGEHAVVVSASNGEAEAAMCSTTVAVRDTTPPVISNISATPNALWPPNGRFVPVRIDVQAEDQCGLTRSRIVRVQSSEPGVDWEITGDLSLSLLATRAGKGQSRVYTVTVQCEDGAGNTSVGSVSVTVPHAQSSNAKLGSR
jgi:hypothetical protein